MDSDGLPIVGSGVDYSKVDPLHQKRTLTFLNHFLIRTTSFLNHFSSVCDEKLENLLIRIQRLEASMCILEAKLASIPGLDDVADAEVAEIPPKQPEADVPEPSSNQSKIEETQSVPSMPSEPPKPKMTISQDPRFSKYFKMISMKRIIYLYEGVPIGAVQLKMTSEGVDPEILNNPDAEAPPGAPEPAKEESELSESSEFSD